MARLYFCLSPPAFTTFSRGFRYASTFVFCLSLALAFPVRRSLGGGGSLSLSDIS